MPLPRTKMAHSFDNTFVLALANPFIVISRMFNAQWYVVKRMEKIGYSEEEVEEAMCANTRTRIEMATPRTLKSVPQPRPLCVTQFQAYVLPQLKSRTSSRKQRCEQHIMLQPVLTAAVRAVQVKQDRTADAVHRPPQPTIPNQSYPRKQTKE